eukprot:TRINITY_DN18727_c0_g1_i1.p1 TRINITY_DN18727_c0_g1~~TRINITY_DN18727_c0_g1_i1.p1  ORF type:complete len:1084 (+),score=221.76 TRINITY_DN18727_c0_g1_i1:46-3252(+)
MDAIQQGWSIFHEQGLGAVNAGKESPEEMMDRARRMAEAAMRQVEPGAVSMRQGRELSPQPVAPVALVQSPQLQSYSPQQPRYRVMSRSASPQPQQHLQLISQPLPQATVMPSVSLHQRALRVPQSSRSVSPQPELRTLAPPVHLQALPLQRPPQALSQPLRSPTPQRLQASPSPEGEWRSLKQEVELVLKQAEQAGAASTLANPSCSLCGSAFDGNCFADHKDRANQRLARALEVVWKKTSAFAEDCTRWHEELRTREREAAELTEIIRQLSQDYAQQVDHRVHALGEESRSEMERLQAEVELFRKRGGRRPQGVLGAEALRSGRPSSPGHGSRPTRGSRGSYGSRERRQRSSSPMGRSPHRSIASSQRMLSAVQASPKKDQSDARHAQTALLHALGQDVGTLGAVQAEALLSEAGHEASAAGKSLAGVSQAFSHASKRAVAVPVQPIPSVLPSRESGYDSWQKLMESPAGAHRLQQPALEPDASPVVSSLAHVMSASEQIAAAMPPQQLQSRPQYLAAAPPPLSSFASSCGSCCGAGVCSSAGSFPGTTGYLSACSPGAAGVRPEGKFDVWPCEAIPSLRQPESCAKAREGFGQCPAGDAGLPHEEPEQDAEEGELFARVRSALARVVGGEAAGALSDPSTVLVPAGWNEVARAPPEPTLLGDSSLLPMPPHAASPPMATQAPSQMQLLAEAVPSAGTGAQQMQEAKSLFDQLDVNGDGIISKEEFQMAEASLMHAMTKPGESLTGTRPSSPSHAGMPAGYAGQVDSTSSTADPLLTFGDVPKDDVMSHHAASPVAMGSYLSQERPAKMTPAAWEVFAEAAAETEKREADALFDRLDADGDGILSPGELMNADNMTKVEADALFRQLDSNGDGAITREELAEAVKVQVPKAPAALLPADALRRAPAAASSSKPRAADADARSSKQVPGKPAQATRNARTPSPMGARAQGRRTPQAAQSLKAAGAKRAMAGTVMTQASRDVSPQPSWSPQASQSPGEVRSHRSGKASPSQTNGGLPTAPFSQRQLRSFLRNLSRPKSPDASPSGSGMRQKTPTPIAKNSQVRPGWHN